MATDDSLSGDNVTIWFAPAGTVGSDLSADGTEFQSFISAFNESGGEKDIETQPVFSDTGIHGQVVRKKPRALKEVTFDIVLRHNSKIINFKTIENGGTIGADGAGADYVVGMLVIQQTDGTNYYYQAFNNVQATVFDTEFQSDEEWKGTLTFKLAPATPAGVSNIVSGDADVTTDLTAWS